jgi:hypothetical protein
MKIGHVRSTYVRPAQRRRGCRPDSVYLRRCERFPHWESSSWMSKNSVIPLPDPPSSLLLLLHHHLQSRALYSLLPLPVSLLPYAHLSGPLPTPPSLLYPSPCTIHSLPPTPYLSILHALRPRNANPFRPPHTPLSASRALRPHRRHKLLPHLPALLRRCKRHQHTPCAPTRTHFSPTQ